MTTHIYEKPSELELARLKAVKSGDWKPYIAMLEAIGNRNQKVASDLKVTTDSGVTINKR